MQGVQYSVDIFCIDATGSMGHLVDTVKTNALHFEVDISRLMEDAGKHINELRVRVKVYASRLASDSETAQIALK